jgi:hypothetical protein
MRFTVKTVMLYIALAAGLLTLYVRYLATYIPVWLLAIPCLILLVGHCLWFWRCKRIVAIGFGGLSILSNGCYVVASIYPDYMLIPLLNIAWMLVLLPSISALGMAWTKLAPHHNAVRRRPPSLSWALVIVVAVMPAVTISTLWPLHLAFLAVRPSLERLADRVEAGHMIASPHWIGPFRLSESAVGADRKTVGLLIDPNPGGRTGFVRVHSEPPEAHRFDLLLGTDTDVELGWGWSYRQDD